MGWVEERRQVHIEREVEAYCAWIDRRYSKRWLGLGPTTWEETQVALDARAEGRACDAPIDVATTPRSGLRRRLERPYMVGVPSPEAAAEERREIFNMWILSQLFDPIEEQLWQRRFADERVITLAHADDVYNFHVGRGSRVAYPRPPATVVMSPGNYQAVVTAIDRENGTVTLEQLRDQAPPPPPVSEWRSRITDAQRRIYLGHDPGFIDIERRANRYGNNVTMPNLRTILGALLVSA